MSCVFVIVVMPTEGPVYMVEVVFFCCFICFCHSFCMPILASRFLGASLAFSSDRGAPIAAWVSPWSKPYASTDLKKKKKKKKNYIGQCPLLRQDSSDRCGGRGHTSRDCVPIQRGHTHGRTGWTGRQWRQTGNRPQSQP